MDKKQLVNKITNELIKLFREALGDAINVKSGTSLKDSKLSKELESSNKGIEIYNILYNDYLQYIESGRKPGAKRVPIQALISWMKEKNISNDNRVAYAIQSSIVKNGIPPRNILTPFGDLVDANIDSITDNIFNYITEEIDNIFKD